MNAGMPTARTKIIARAVIATVGVSIVGFLVVNHVSTAARLSSPHRIVYTDDHYRPVAEARTIFPDKASCDAALMHPTDNGLPWLMDTPYFAAGCVPDKRPYPNEVKG